MSPVKKYCFLALITALALILGIVENMLPPPLPVPGVKLGIANVFILAAIAFFRFRDCLAVVVVRNLLSLLLTGNPVSFLLSICGGLAALFCMYPAYRCKHLHFSVIGASVVGSVAHVCTQLIVASLLMQNAFLFATLPLLLVSSVIAGVLTGLLSALFIRIIKRAGLPGI